MQSALTFFGVSMHESLAVECLTRMDPTKMDCRWIHHQARNVRLELQVLHRPPTSQAQAGSSHRDLTSRLPAVHVQMPIARVHVRLI